MNPRSLAMMAVAIVCGLGAMIGSNRLLSRKAEPAVETVEILVAARDLKTEEVLKPDMVKASKVPKASAPAGAFTSFKEVEDRWLQLDLLEGEPLLDRKLAPRGTPAGLVARIPKGMRAFAIEVNEQSSVSGFVLPDHRVDVVVHRQPQGGLSQGPKDRAPEAETILEDVRVLASGQTFSRPDDRSIQSRTVTLALTPDQVATVVAAKAKGSLSLALRGVNDHDPVRPARRAGPSALERIAEALAKLPPPEDPKPAAAAPKPATAPPPRPAPVPAPARPPGRVVTVHRGPSLPPQRVTFGHEPPPPAPAPAPASLAAGPGGPDAR